MASIAAAEKPRQTFHKYPFSSRLATEKWRQGLLPVGVLDGCGMRDARLERWKSYEELVAVVSVELPMHGSGVSFACKIQPCRFYRGGSLGCRARAMEAHHVCRQA